MKTYMVRFGHTAPHDHKLWAVQSIIGTCIVQHYVGYFLPAVLHLVKAWFTTEVQFWKATEAKRDKA